MIVPIVQMGMSADYSGPLESLKPLLAQFSSDSLILAVSLGFLSLFLLKNAVILATIYLVTHFTLYSAAAFRKELFELYLTQPYSYHLQRNSAEMLRNLTNGIGAAFDGLRLGLNLLLDLVLSAAAFTILVIVEPVLTISLTVGVGGAGVAFYMIVGPLIQRWGKQAFHLEAQVIKAINFGLGAIKDIKILNAEAHTSHLLNTLSISQARILTRSVVANQTPRLFVELLIIVALLSVAAALISSDKPLESILAMAGTFALAALRLMPSMNRIISSTTELRQRTALVEDLHKDLIEGRRLQEYTTKDEGAPALPFTDRFQIANVTFQYPGSAVSAIEDINLTIKRGESIGLVGGSGAGKTTMVDLILGLLKPNIGTMTVDGIDIQPNLRSWQKDVGYVPQDIFIVDDTLRRNIALGKNDEDIDPERMQQALRIAQLDDVVANLPEGLDTVLGEHGARLSGGQRQRVGIARALYPNPQILILDEATSALDSQTESSIAAAMESLMGEKTMVIIAHRLATVRHCDFLVYMEQGRIAAMGRFDDLVKSNAGFAKLVQLGSLVSGEKES
ncbi:putative ABC transporter ATP-binding protein [Magnetospira sp. QH-2]|nr:putative ABC transporter ATP-binding protein [Magnetospira sp. QH-2]